MEKMEEENSTEETGSLKKENIISCDLMMTNKTGIIAPVIIEEIDGNETDVDFNEFVEAEALKMTDISNYLHYDPSTSSTLNDIEEQECLRWQIEEDKLTKQFLNGEIEFCEYSLRMDKDTDLEVTDSEFMRRDGSNEQIARQRSSLKKSQRASNIYKQKRKRRTLPPALQGLMGEANLRFARGDIDLATKICMEIIRQVPSAPEPYHTLAMIYENDQPEKALQVALIAAHLSPKDADQWARLANLSLESGNVKQAIACYSKAIQASPKDINLYELRAQLQEQNGDRRAFLRGYSKLVTQLEPEDGEYIVKCAKMLAKRYMQENNNEQALDAMENIFTKALNLITLEEVNIMTELLIALKNFQRCLDILTKYTSIWVKFEANHLEDNALKEKQLSDTIYKIKSCDIPEDVVVDLKAKFLIVLIELNEIDKAKNLLPKLYTKENPEISGDLFLDVAEALMEKNEFKQALLLLDPLVKSTNYSLAAVWLRHAECWAGCKDTKKAIASYEVVRELSPQHLGARLSLAKLYKSKNQFNKAIEVLKQDPQCDTLDPEVIYKRTLLLLKVRRYSEYFKSGMLLFSRHCATIRSKAELNTIVRATGVRQRLEALQLQRLSCGEKIEDENAPTFLNSAEPSESKEFSLFLQMGKLAYKLKKFGLLQRICFSALTSKKFEKKNSYIMFLCLIACIYNNDSFYGYNIVRELVRVCQRSNSWNLLNIIIQKAEDSRHNRFIMRILGREDVFSYMHIMHANNCLVSGTYKYALNDYISLFRVSPSALLSILIAVTLLQMACQKLASKKNQLVVQAMAFLKKYSQLRGKGGKQEVYYNSARLFHQIGLLPTAIHYYKLVLENDLEEVVLQNANLLDLRREAAFNLHLIYLHSDNVLLARSYLDKYITV